MPYRFAATKKSFELTSIEEIKNHPSLFIVKDDTDYKGVGFAFVWDRLDKDTFKLTCYHKGVFSEMNDDFKELIKQEPLGIVNTILLKELFNVEYKTNPTLDYKDLVYTSEIKFKFLELFEDENVVSFYIARLVEKFDWKLQIQEPGFEDWEDFII